MRLTELDTNTAVLSMTSCFMEFFSECWSHSVPHDFDLADKSFSDINNIFT